MHTQHHPSWLLTALLIAAALANLRWQNAAVGLMFGIGYLWWCARLAGRVLAPQEPRRWQLLVGLLGHLALLAVAGSLSYWGYRLNGTMIAVLVAMLPLVWLALPHGRGQPEKAIRQRDVLRGLPRTMGVTTWLLLGFVGLITLAFWQLITAATTEAIRTPWQVVSPTFWVAFTGAAAALVGLHLRTDRAGRRLLGTLVLIAVASSVALVVYPLGYGFDPFIHQAAERLIAATGVIRPKNPYYIGQYALVVPLARLLGLATTAIDRAAAPVGVLLVAALAYWPWRRHHPTAAALPLVLLLLPLSSVIATTPQGLANLWTVATALAVTLPATPAAQTTRQQWLPFALLTAAAAAVTHPIAGVPAFTLVSFGMIARWRVATRRARLWSPLLASLAVFALAVIALPLLFILNAKRNGLNPADVWQPGSLTAVAAPALLPSLPTSTQPLLDFAAGLAANRGWLLVAFAALGLGWFWSQRKTAGALPVLATSLALLATSAVLRPMQFPELVTEEQAVFARRTLELASLVLLPLLIAGAQALLVRINREPILRLAAVTLGAATLTAAVYLAYPRVDRYRVDRGYNLTATDIAAVHLVRNDARGEYLVLANQMTSAAAIREFGFSPSYPAADRAGHQYYAYPIPTGQPLYQHYLAMVYQSPSRETAQRAARLVAAEIRSVYFILNRYWDNFDAIASTAERLADRWWTVDEGRALVFRYDLQ